MSESKVRIFVQVQIVQETTGKKKILHNFVCLTPKSLYDCHRGKHWKEWIVKNKQYIDRLTFVSSQEAFYQ